MSTIDGFDEERKRGLFPHIGARKSLERMALAYGSNININTIADISDKYWRKRDFYDRQPAKKYLGEIGRINKSAHKLLWILKDLSNDNLRILKKLSQEF